MDNERYLRDLNALLNNNNNPNEDTKKQQREGGIFHMRVIGLVCAWIN